MPARARRNPFRSASLRLALLYALAFVLSVVTIGAITLAATRATLSAQFNQRIRGESVALTREFKEEHLIGVQQAIEERTETPGALDYGLQGPHGEPVAGALAGASPPNGWSTLPVRQASGEIERVRVYASRLPDGYRLFVGGENDAVTAIDSLIVSRLLIASLGVALVAVLIGISFGRSMGNRIAAITGAAEAIIDGDLSRRVAEARPSDDLGYLAATFNRMLDRIQTLMESLRQVSNDVAHDLRSPLTRLRNRLEKLQRESPELEGAEITGALGDLDAILDTFAALLRIAQIEGGARRAGFASIDLAEIGRLVVDAFAPSAEERGLGLTLEAPAAVWIDGDRELLTQLLVNLVENAILHAGQGTATRVFVGRVGGRPELVVADNGPGVPAADRQRIFERFFRREQSRSMPGSGLGLSLVAAVARLHGATVAARDADPGLAIHIQFP